MRLIMHAKDALLDIFVFYDNSRTIIPISRRWGVNKILISATNFSHVDKGIKTNSKHKNKDLL